MVKTSRELVDETIASGDYEKAIEYFARTPDLSGSDEVAFALVLMAPPVADWDEALTHIRKAIETEVDFEATVWGAYICIELYPITDEFHVRLRNFADHAEACYLMAMREISDGHVQLASELIQSALKIEQFPNALRLAAKFAWPDQVKSNSLLLRAMNQVQETCLEKKPWHEVCPNRNGLRHSNWKELIRGELLTSQNWDAFYGNVIHESGGTSCR